MVCHAEVLAKAGLPRCSFSEGGLILSEKKLKKESIP